MPYKDEEKAKACREEYRKKNKDIINAKTKEWRKKNKEYVDEYSKKYSKSISGKYQSYKNGATKRGYSFDLSEEEFSTFWNKPCYYCGTDIDTVGIDRIDSSVGYSINNCRSCCFLCNRMKSDLEESLWLQHIKKILNRQNQYL